MFIIMPEESSEDMIKDIINDIFFNIPLTNFTDSFHII